MIVIGSGIAGLYTSIEASRHLKVAIVNKSSLEECNTKYAQGGIAAAIGPFDSPNLHFNDTIRAGAGLVDPTAARILVEEAPDRISDLISLGVTFDTVDGEITLAREGAHTVPRVLHSGGDATGANIEQTLGSLVRRNQNISIFEDHLATEILVKGAKAYGIRALDRKTSLTRTILGKYIVLATGGAGMLFKQTTNPQVATGAGVSIAYLAGALVSDMEFFQFHPTALCKPGAPRFLISEAVRGEGGILRNSKGEAFAHNYHPDGELASRDIVSRAILAEMSKTNSDHVYLDITHMPSKIIVTRFPSIYRFCLTQGLDITKEMIPVAPAAHYMIGGVKTNVWGETNIRGLYACGEAACTGVHGANRLASNSLMETLVFGKRIAKRILSEDQWIGSATEPSDMSTSLENYAELFRDEHHHRSAGADDVGEFSLADLQELMWNNVGIIRSGENLTAAVRQLSRWFREEADVDSSDPQKAELGLMITCALLISATALIRTESRGTHYRVDYPSESIVWRKHVLFQRIRNWDQ
ncbi:MAG: L-aspartate oxidase [Promethearchaeati archaeon SRVP18_Atabeyarchaeia-1]